MFYDQQKLTLHCSPFITGYRQFDTDTTLSKCVALAHNLFMIENCFVALNDQWTTATWYY